ncbi:MAG: hypothetical protein CMP59_03750 [Flavobacteriales bacterium]|nr:hypothetical protein [Flavobacteriales bacterium]|tara:strand:- start:2558 stop:3250 length:693 start_codon:yes stop_codon:yes gene_type:complete
MKINTVDLHEQLIKIQKKHPSESILEEVEGILQNEEQHEKRIIESIENGSNGLSIDESLLDQEQIFSIDQIEKLCIKYRLRFLDSKHFKGEIPYAAIQKIKKLETEFGVQLNGFKIIAPKELFRLTDKDSDPILMLPLKNNRFYFIHKWGGEISALRALLAFPMRNFMSMFWFLAALAVVFSWAVPTPSFDVFIFLVVHSFIGICGLACMLVFTMRENFSTEEWNSKYFS